MVTMLPTTPAEVLDISTPILRSEIDKLVKNAIVSGEWLHPYKDAAACFDEMTITDMGYWVYKCTNPVIKYEENKIDNALNAKKEIIRLPEGFHKSTTITLGAAGDILQAEGLDNSKDVLYADIADLLFTQDLSFANFESPVTTQPLVKEIIGDKAPPTECCSNEQFDTLTSHDGKSFTVLNVANNHIFDMGYEGVRTTLSAFADKDILGIGANLHRGSTQEKTLHIKGIKFGFASCTYGLNGHVVPKKCQVQINESKLLSKVQGPNLSSIMSQIDECKKQLCDFIIVSLHWGFEFEFFPRKKQIQIVRFLVEYGADAIICHHPHVIQPIEYYRTKRDPNRVATIAYSLGSLTWGYSAPHLVLSLIQNLTISKGKLEGKTVTYIVEANVTPVFRDITIQDKKIVTRIKKLDGYKEQDSIQSSEFFEELYSYAKLVLEDDFIQKNAVKPVYQTQKMNKASTVNQLQDS